MPFNSKSQSKYLHSIKSELVKEFTEKTKNLKKLPKKYKHKRYYA